MIVGNNRREQILSEINDERLRQQMLEGHREIDDDELDNGQLALAAAAYASHCAGTFVVANELWPFDMTWFKPKIPRQNLVRAAALIVAEIERIDRAEEAAERGRS